MKSQYLEKEPEFEGIMFTLKKREPQSFKSDGTSDGDYYDYSIFGYYDGLAVDYVDRWYQYRPMGVAYTCGYLRQDRPFADVYTIKCVFPEQHLMQDSQFAFEEWKKIGGKKEVLPDRGDSSVNELMQIYHYICVSSLHLSETFVSKDMDLSSMTGKVMEQVRKEAEKRNWNLRELHCAVFPTIGFSDYVIVFLADNFEKPAELISAMRTWTEMDQDAVVSNCYTLCGVHKEFRVTADILRKAVTTDGDYQVRMVAKFALREGVSGDEFHAALKREILQKVREVMKGEKDPSAFERGLEKELETYYKTFGNVDTLIMPNICLEAYLCLYTDEKFGMDSQLFNRYIAGTRTGIRIVKKLTSGMEKIQIPDMEDPDLSEERGGIEGQPSGQSFRIDKKIHEKWNRFIREFERRLCEHHCAVRTSRAVEQIIRRYYNIADTTHGFDIRESMQNFLDVVFDDILLSFQCSGVKMDDILRAVDLFRDLVGDYVADLLRSDKPFIEGNALAHPAIGSGTKMLFAYTSIMNEMSRLLQKSGLPNSKNEIVFMVISGGADRTRAIDLFKYLIKERFGEASPEKFYKPVLIVVPEKGLYDIRGTLFRMLHECMHFCGNRERRYRCQMLIQMMAAWIAQDIVWGYLENTECSSKTYLQYERMYLKDDEYADMLQEAEAIIQNAEEQARQEIGKAVCELPLFQKYVSKYRDDTDYYEYKLFGEEAVLGLRSVTECFMGCRDKSGLSAGSMYECINNSLEQMEFRIITGILAKLKEKRLPYAVTMFRQKKWEYSIKRHMRSQVWDFTEVYYRVLSGDISVLEYEECKRLKDLFTYEEIAQMAFCSMREGLADYNAVRLLNMELPDYLLSFIYEEKDINKAMPDTLDNAMRIGAVLKCAFGVSRKLKKKDRASVLTRAENMYRYAGYEYDAIGCGVTKISTSDMPDYREKREIKGMKQDQSAGLDGVRMDQMKAGLTVYMDRIDELLTVYQEALCALAAPYLERYLKRAGRHVDDMKESEIAELREAYQSACMYRKEDTDKALEYIFGKWQKLGGGNVQ